MKNRSSKIRRGGTGPSPFKKAAEGGVPIGAGRWARRWKGQFEMSVTVRIPTPLRPVTSGQAEIKVEGTTVGEVLRKLDSQFKGFGDRVFDEDRNVKRFINVFVNEENIRDRKELDTEVRSGDIISILPSIAGGN